MLFDWTPNESGPDQASAPSHRRRTPFLRVHGRRLAGAWWRAQKTPPRPAIHPHWARVMPHVVLNSMPALNPHVSRSEAVHQRSRSQVATCRTT